jgi:hypothetical protein
MLELLVVINQTLYCVALFLQIFKNRQDKQTGLSDLFLAAMTNAYVFFTFYFICLRLPVGYQVSVIIQLVSSVVLVAQRFVYAQGHFPIRLLWYYGLNSVAFLALLRYAMQYPVVVGQYAGWIALLLIIGCRIPQVVKIYRTKKVANFSKAYVLLIVGAAAMELGIAVMYALPLQTVSSSSLTLLSSLIFIVQFKLYSK